MKTIGVIGGMSWQSSQLYYRWLNEAVAARLGGLHSAKIIMSSVDFAEVQALQARGDWDAGGQLLADIALRLQQAGADIILLATNTMHQVASAIEAALDVPFLHIADATAEAVTGAGLRKVGLLGTIYTMELGFYRDRLAQQGIEAIVPGADARRAVNDIIYGELCQGQVRPASKARYLDIVGDMCERGIQGLILGCTEITMLIGAADVPCPVFDTTRIHVEAAVDAATG